MRILRIPRIVLLTAAALAVLLPTVGRAQERPVRDELLRQPWAAEWIAHPTADPTAFGVYHFRRAFELDEAPSAFVIHVSADNRYRLFVNGTSVGAGPARGDIEHWRYETYDIGPLLQSGPNVVAATVWNYADLRPVAQQSLQTAFLVQGDDAAASVVNTGEAWRVLRDEAYTPIPVDRAALGWPYIVVGPGERVDGAAYPWGWREAEYDAAEWQPAESIVEAVPRLGYTRTGLYPYWKLVPRQIPMMEEARQSIARIARAEGVEPHEGFLHGGDPLVIPPNTHATILLDQSFLTTAYPVVRTDGGAGSRIRLTYAEALFDADGDKGHRDVIEGKTIRGYSDEILPDGGEDRRFQSLWWRTWRYLQLDVETADEPLVLREVSGVFTAYPFEERAAFAASDTSLADIWNVGWRTARLCAGETYFDCPYYEQLQYVGDTRVQALISLYVSGDDRLMRKAIQAFYDSRTPDGLTAARHPDAHHQLIPPYALYWISMVHDYWMHRDDPAFVADQLTAIRGVVDWYADYVDEMGMLAGMPYWNYIDWSYPERGVPPGADDGHSSVVALTFVYAAQQAADLADAFGRSDEAAHYRRLATVVRDATVRQTWDDDRGLLADTPQKDAFSVHANVMGVLTGAFPTGEAAGVLQRALAADGLVPASYYFQFYVVQALHAAGLAERYVDRLDPWRQQLALGLTTFAERPDRPGAPTRSDCHAWSSSPNYDFLATVLGIRPAAPGFARVEVAPALGALAWAEGTLPHPKGDLHVRVERLASGLQATVTLPDGVAGTFRHADEAVDLAPGSQTFQIEEGRR